MADEGRNIERARMAFRDVLDDLEPYLMDVARRANTLISRTATTDYMIDAGKEVGRLSRTQSIGPNPGRFLRILTARLRRSLMGSFTALVEGQQREGFVEIDIRPGPVMRFVKGSRVPYADIHEHGGTITVPVTERMRKFFWAQWYATGEDRWKGMALTKVASFTIRIPARPYLGPAFTDEAPVIQLYADEQLAKLVTDKLAHRI